MPIGKVRFKWGQLKIVLAHWARGFQFYGFLLALDASLIWNVMQHFPTIKNFAILLREFTLNLFM